MQQADIIRVIEQTAPLVIAASWDKSGIQVASLRASVSCLAVCLDPSPTSVEAALAAGAEMVLSHHPLSLEPRFPDRPDSYHKVLSLLFNANVSLYAAHTSLDANPLGPVAWLAEELELAPLPVQESPSNHTEISGTVSASLSILEPTGFMEQNGTRVVCGFGMGGVLPHALSPADFREKLSPWLKGSCPRLVGTLPSRIRRVAFCPGSGSSLVDDAASLKADVFITGDVKYHPALEFPLPVLDVGHFCLEEEMMRRFALQLEKKLSQVRVIFISAIDPLQAF